MSDIPKKDEGTQKPVDNQPKETNDFEKKLDEMRKEMNEKFTAEVDRRVTKFVNENSELKKKLDEFEKTSMTKAEYERKKEEERIKQFEQRENEFNKKELDYNKGRFLMEKGLEIDLLEIVSGDSLDAFKLNTEKLNDKVNKLVEKRVQERLGKGNPTPKTGDANVPPDIYTLEQLRGMTKQEHLDNIKKSNESYKYWAQRGK